MEKLPLYLRLKRETHRKIAEAQDIIINEVYKKFDREAILHGGTAIWRCYSGKRFSEDLDFYLPNDKLKIEELFASLEKRGFKIIKKKISNKSVYSDLELNRTIVRLEATFQRAKGVLTDYEMTDGNIMSIFSLTPEDFIIEKINTYLKRFKIRDLWDVFFLLRIAKDINGLKRELVQLINNYKSPLDESNLKSVIIEGFAPSSKEMMEYIKRKWEK